MSGASSEVRTGFQDLGQGSELQSFPELPQGCSRWGEGVEPPRLEESSLQILLGPQRSTV